MGSTDAVGENLCMAMDGGDMASSITVSIDKNKERNSAVCRVCQCTESDRRGDAALGFLNIMHPSTQVPSKEENNSLDEATTEDVDKSVVSSNNCRSESNFVKFISPNGEVFICSTDLEAGEYQQQDNLITLGCSCKSDLSLAHYACALKWFVSHGSTVCEICGSVAKNVQAADFKKVIISLKDYEALRERTATGELSPAHAPTNSDVDPDAVAAIRRQRLSEISLWFNPQSNNSTGVVLSQLVTEQSSSHVVEDAPPEENTTRKWAVESTGILVATGLLTVTLAWLIAPRVGKVGFYRFFLESFDHLLLPTV